MLRKQRVLLAAVATLAVAGSAVLILQNRPQATAGSSNTQSPISNPKSLPLLPVVKQIVKEGPQMPYLKLNYVIKELPTDLAQHDIDALLKFITGPQPASFGDMEWGSLTNDIQEALSVQTEPNSKVAETLIATYRDGTRSQLMRDYALQHIGGFAIYLVHTAHTRKGALPQFFGELTSELLAAAKDRSKPWCGTSLNMLDGLLRAAEYRSMEIDGVTADALMSLAIPVAENSAAPLNARLPALQLASRRGSTQSLKLAREILGNPDSGVMPVQSASAVLGRLGSTEDLPMLQAVAATSSRHTATALKEAIRSIQTRSQSE